VPAIAPTHRSFSRTSLTVLPPHENFDHENTAAKSQATPLIITKTKMAYYCAGSGIPEVKVILGGFVIKGFLGIKTLFVKSVGLVGLMMDWSLNRKCGFYFSSDLTRIIMYRFCQRHLVSTAVKKALSSTSDAV
jgi:hypothetical protein